jgi:hypothetical protein
VSSFSGADGLELTVVLSFYLILTEKRHKQNIRIISIEMKIVRWGSFSGAGVVRVAVWRGVGVRFEWVGRGRSLRQMNCFLR